MGSEWILPRRLGRGGGAGVANREGESSEDCAGGEQADDGRNRGCDCEKWIHRKLLEVNGSRRRCAKDVRIGAMRCDGFKGCFNEKNSRECPAASVARKGRVYCNSARPIEVNSPYRCLCG